MTRFRILFFQILFLQILFLLWFLHPVPGLLPPRPKHHEQRVADNVDDGRDEEDESPVLQVLPTRDDVADDGGGKEAADVGQTVGDAKQRTCGFMCY